MVSHCVIDNEAEHSPFLSLPFGKTKERPDFQAGDLVPIISQILLSQTKTTN